MRAVPSRSSDHPPSDARRGAGCRPPLERTPLLDLDEPVLIASAAGHVIECNAAASALFGRSRPPIGAAIEALLPFVEPPASGAGLPISHGVLRHAAGHCVAVDVRCSALRGPASAGTHVYLLHDVSQHVEITRSREQLLFAVAHELRTPLGVIENALEMLDADFTHLSAAEIDYLVGVAHGSAAHLHGLMEALLSAGAIQSGRFAVSVAPVPVAALIETALAQVEGALAERGQRVHRDPPAERITVAADRCFAGQAIVNLLNNAIKYSPRGSTIQICVEPEESMVRIAVTDRGAGIPPEHLEGIFDRFYRASNTANTPGIGLGLAIVRGIAEAHGGTVGIRSTLGAGTTVWFTLPATVAAV